MVIIIDINTKNDSILKEKMVVTNEPGIYIPGKFGVRIEDTVLITKTGSINLTKSDKNYIVIEGKQEKVLILCIKCAKISNVK